MKWILYFVCHYVGCTIAIDDYSVMYNTIPLCCYVRRRISIFFAVTFLCIWTEFQKGIYIWKQYMKISALNACLIWIPFTYILPATITFLHTNTCMFIFFFFSVFLGNIKQAFDKNPNLSNLLLDDFFKKEVQKCQVMILPVTLFWKFSTIIKFWDYFQL